MGSALTKWDHDAGAKQSPKLGGRFSGVVVPDKLQKSRDPNKWNKEQGCGLFKD